MKNVGALTFVLHSHIPYARFAGRWPHGEEWLHEAAAESYVPLLNALFDLEEDQIPARLTLTLSPVLVEQLADQDIQSNFQNYVRTRIQAAEADLERFQAIDEPLRVKLAKFYLERYRTVLSSFENRFQKDLVAAFRRLQDAGRIEIATCAATHAYLPLLGMDESIHLQLRTAVESYRRHFGRDPRVIWLPECAYRPGYRTKEGLYREGLEAFLAKYDLRLFFAEAHMIETARSIDPAAGSGSGSHVLAIRKWIRSLLTFLSRPRLPTYRPYWVTSSGVAVIGRNGSVGEQVWSAEKGYPGDFSYREFHKKDGQSGLQYWRVTGDDVDLGEKDDYDPGRASERVQVHAEHFSQLVGKLLKEYSAQSGETGVVSANYDTELFGHWWFEGVDWLDAVLRRLAGSDEVAVTGAWSYLQEHPPSTAVMLPEGSWGEGGKHDVWDNEETAWMWPLIHEAESRMRRLAGSGEGLGALLNQAARELLLLQSSDWPFLVTTGQARDYAETRFRQHLLRFNQLLDAAESGERAEALVEELWEKDKIFPEIDHRWFSK